MIKHLRLWYARFKLRLVEHEIKATTRQLRHGPIETAEEIPLLNRYIEQCEAERIALRSRIQLLNSPQKG